MADKITPLMRQYNDIKSKYPGTILLFRLGDFFETFDEDAVLTARACGITLTKRNNGAAGDMPLAGFPHHQLDAYLPKLIKAGYRVAVCEQLEDPKQAKGIVKRGVTEVVTPGVALYDKILNSKANNYVCAITLDQMKSGNFHAGVAWCDISTGEFNCTELGGTDIINLLESFSPSEIIINKSRKHTVEAFLSDLSFEPSYTRLEEWIFEEDFGREQLQKLFATKGLKGFGIEGLNKAITAAGAIVHYISETQNSNLPQITGIRLANTSESMILDYSTRRNLEITLSNSITDKSGSLISVLDKTHTSMGGRLFRQWITQPLLDLSEINQRHDAVEVLFQDKGVGDLLSRELKNINDIERLIARISVGKGSPRDVAALRASLTKIPVIKDYLNEKKYGRLKFIFENLNELPDLLELLNNAIVEEPNANFGTGNIFKSGFNTELDSYVDARYSGKNWIRDYQDSERSKTGIPSLKVGYNSVFGYYIEVTKVHSSKVPENYQRKQTLTNSERYTTAELKDIENKILNAEDKILELEQRLFSELKTRISEYINAIQLDAYLIAELDCLLSYASASLEYGYVRPEIEESGIIEISEGRHPVVERLLPIGESFTPNNTFLDTTSQQVQIITGPNMSGKSCYLRQVALIVLLAQAGCFVPAKKARLGIIDRIFTRVGAQDNITAGESTFLVEMQEAANIMNNASEKSLILLDEVGRGTATFDGISIAWSIAEYIHNHIAAKTLFATHYHELNDLAERYERIVNYKVEVVEADGTVLFTHKVKPGASDHSFGIHVAKMAGLPYDVIERSNEIMQLLEGRHEKTKDLKTRMKKLKSKHSNSENQLAIFEFRDDGLRERLKNINIDNVTPVQALQILQELKNESKKGS